MKHLLKSTFGSPIALLINLLLAYIIYALARLTYVLVNYSYFAEGLEKADIGQWIKGSLMFDTTAICYTHIPYIVLMLLPLWLKETRFYHHLCKWLFVIVNAVALAINLADAVYFPFTLRRTTTTVFQEFSNENNIATIILHNTLTHWYLFLVFAVLIWGLSKLYVMPRTDYRDFFTGKKRLGYTVKHLVCLAIAGVATVAGCRGGLQSGVRPITISNANQFVERPTDCAVVLNTPFALIRTIGKSNFEIPPYFASLNEAAKVYSPVHMIVPKGKSNKKNIVILIVESFGREYIGGFNKDFFGGKYKGYTPNVDRLIEKSMVFRYSFCNGRKSIDGMPSILCGSLRRTLHLDTRFDE